MKAMRTLAFGVFVMVAAVTCVSAQEDFLLDALGGQLATPGFRLRASLDYPKQAAGFPTLARVDVACDPEFYVWAESIEVAVADAGEATRHLAVERLFLPPHKEKHDENIKDTVRYFDGEFAFRVLLDIAGETPPGEYDVALQVTYTGCGPGICQLGKDRVSVLLTVSGGSPVPIEFPETHGAAEVEPARALPDAPILALLVAYLWGWGLALTPCIYPLIPVTVSVVGATAGRSRLDGFVRSLVYVLGIAVSYSVVGTIAAATGGVFGTLLQHPAIYVALAVAFVLLAGAMFDLYAIDVTSQHLQRMQNRLRGRAGLIGILAIGLLSGVTATACIAPVILGLLTYVAQRGSPVLGFMVFFALAWGMGTPLVFLGTFTGLAKSITKPGGWMVAVKKALGVALLAMAAYYLAKSGLLPEGWLTALIGGLLLAAGVLTWASDERSAAVATGLTLRKVLSLALLAGAVWVFVRLGAEGRVPSAGTSIDWLESEPAALELAQAEQKPVLLDFWAEWCSACHKMDGTTFVDAAVVTEARRFVCARVDHGGATEQEIERFSAEYGVRGLPTVVLIGTDGQRRSEVGYIGSARMLGLLKSVR